MRVMTEADEKLLDTLLHLAGGDSTIVMQVMSKPGRSTIPLDTLANEIRALREEKRRGQAQQRGSGSAGAGAGRLITV